MTMPSVTIAMRQPEAKDCACGCAECVSIACRLDCIERPRFFCGQLLTDQDLTALVTWAQERMRLLRFRDGWGVVCGLDLRVSPDGGGVLVGPGYAVSECGDDVLICADSAVEDLGAICTSAEADCANPKRWRAEEPEEAPRLISVGGYNVPADELYAVDVSLSYAEEHFQAQTALGRGSCGQAGECEFGRTREAYKLSRKLVALDSSPAQAELEGWLLGYKRITAGLAEISSWNALRVTLAEEPLRQFPFVGRWLDEIGQGDGGEAALARLWLWVLQDRRNGYLLRKCMPGGDSPGVPLGRVLLRSVSEGGRTRCRVLAVDSGMPYRRAFTPAALPAPEGELNLGRFIWQSPALVVSALADLGYTVATQAFEPPAMLADLKSELDQHVITTGLGARLTALVLDAGQLGRRVIGFRRDLNSEPVEEAGAVLSRRRAR